jgi:hypothetical protein
MKQLRLLILSVVLLPSLVCADTAKAKLSSQPVQDSSKNATVEAARLRKEFAKRSEVSLLKSGYDVYLGIQGKDNTVLYFRSRMVDRPFANQIINDAALFKNLRNLGFKMLILTDGFNKLWSLKVN